MDAASPPEVSQDNIGQMHRRARIGYAIAWGLIILAFFGISWNVLAMLDDYLANTEADSFAALVSACFFRLWLAGLALAALSRLAFLIGRPSQWENIRTITWIVLCAFTVAGFPLTSSLDGLLAALSSGVFMGFVRLVLLPLALPFAGLVSIGGLVALIAILSAGIMYLIYDLPFVISDYFAERGVRSIIREQRRNGLLMYVRYFRCWLFDEPLPPLPPDESKGARMATKEEILALHQETSPESMGFGHVGGAPYALTTDKHVLIMASTRSGKGVTIIIPHLLRYQGSAFVLDPKGENARATGRRRAELNEVVHYLDPFGISGKPRSRFNPLARFTVDNMEAESKALAGAFFVVSDQKRDHWIESAQQLLASIILYVYVSPNYPPEKKDLPAVRRILLGGLKPALEQMMQIDDADGLLRDLAFSFLSTPEKEFGSIVSTAQRQTEILDNPYIIACLSASGLGPEVDFKAWHKGTMTVYLCLSAPKFPIFNRWLRLVLTSALDEMTDTLDPPALPVCFMLDELATLGHLAAVENAVGLAAGYGIQLVSVFQDIAQMRDLYRTRWASFVGNAGVRALFNLDDFDTAEYWSKFIGGRIVDTHSRQEDGYGFSNGQNVGEALRPLFSSDKLMMDFAAGKMLVLAQGVRPIITKRIAYFDDRYLAGMWDDPRPNAPPRPPAPPTTPPPASPPESFGPAPTPPTAPTTPTGPRPEATAPPWSYGTGDRATVETYAPSEPAPTEKTEKPVFSQFLSTFGAPRIPRGDSD
jgi:type IV secretion system protein VirD4